MKPQVQTKSILGALADTVYALLAAGLYLVLQNTTSLCIEHQKYLKSVEALQRERHYGKLLFRITFLHDCCC